MHLCKRACTRLSNRGILIVWDKGGFHFFQVHLSFSPSLSFASCFFSPSFLPWNNKVVWPLSYGELLKWPEEPVNLVGTFGSCFSGAVAAPIFHMCMCVCLSVLTWVTAVASFFVRHKCVQTWGVHDVCTYSSGSLFHSHADLWPTSGFPGAINLAGQTALEADTHAHVCLGLNLHEVCVLCCRGHHP